jgi:hypothetical protein
MKEKVQLENYKPSPQQKSQLEMLFKILDFAESKGIAVYVTGGYGLDALYGKLTRDHRDIELYIKEHQTERFETLLNKLGFTPTGELIGEVGKKEFVHKDFPKGFTLEYGTFENAQRLISGDNCIERALPDKPLGKLEGKKVPVPTLKAFKKAIEINNSPLAKHTEPYRHQKWLDAILPKIEAKFGKL